MGGEHKRELQYLGIKNLERFQHYKSKNESAPAWIKLHRSLLCDYEFSQLTDISKAHLMLIWVQASQSSWRIPYDARWVADKVGASSKIDLECLIEAGFLTLERSDDTTLERPEDDSESTLERSRECGSSLISSSSPDLQEEESEGKPEKPPPLTPEDLVEGWNEVCAPAGLPKVEMLSATRRQKALCRLRDHPDDAFWNVAMARVRASPFLTGKNERKWKANFDWLIDNDTNAVKVYEGRYAKEN